MFNNVHFHFDINNNNNKGNKSQIDPSYIKKSSICSEPIEPITDAAFPHCTATESLQGGRGMHCSLQKPLR